MADDTGHSCDICHGKPVIGRSNCGPVVVPCPGLARYSENARLAGEIRATEWALGDLVTAVTYGKDEPEDLEQTAVRLEQMATILRARARAQAVSHVLDAGNAGSA